VVRSHLRKRTKVLLGTPVLYAVCLLDLLINDYLSPKSLFRPDQMSLGVWEATLALALTFTIIYGFTLILCPLIIVRRFKRYLASKSNGELRRLILEALLFGFMFILGLRLLIHTVSLPLIH
jgi:hypothetical protein